MHVQLHNVSLRTPSVTHEACNAAQCAQALKVNKCKAFPFGRRIRCNTDVADCRAAAGTPPTLILPGANS